MHRTGLTHLAFRVGDLDDLCRRIEAGGGRVLPATTATFEQGNRGVMTLDPDGTRIELIERPSA
jgi:predicted enzyme related to lactoylglutathione lyase